MACLTQPRGNRGDPCDVHIGVLNKYKEETQAITSTFKSIPKNLQKDFLSFSVFLATAVCNDFCAMTLVENLSVEIRLV